MNPIVLDALSKKYPSPTRGKGQWAVRNVSLEIEKGVIFGFLGPNGAGKTTTIKMIMGLTRPTSGHIALWGTSHTHAGTRKRIGFLPENPQFPPTLTAREILAWTGQMMEMPSSSIARKVEEALKGVLLDGTGKKRWGLSPREWFSAWASPRPS